MGDQVKETAMSLTYAPEHQTAPSIADVMERVGVQMSFAKGEEIFGQDEDADLIYCVATGVVRTTRLQNDGRRQIGDFYYPGDLVGLETGAAHRFSAEALADGVMLAVRWGSARTFGGDGEFNRAIWDATRRELERTREHLMMLGRRTACEKVASFLMDVAQRHGGEDVPLPMGRQDMADYLGLTIETVSRMVTQLQGSQIITFAGSRCFRVKRWQALKRLAQ
jgi:CRP/FNR family nitrogen fixation transcriptional regulator